jgi:predicted anti-sigma-YlaC factor YlaD
MESLCEAVRLAAMALADGTAASLTSTEVDAHLGQCPTCRAEVEGLRALASLLARQTRKIPTDDVWPGVRAAMENEVASRRLWREGWVLAGLGIFLLVFRLSLFAPVALPWLVPNGAAALVVLLAFALLWENPLRVRKSLHLAKGADL